MGALCCCFNVPDVEEDAGPTGPGNRCHCICCIVQTFVNKCGSLFTNGGTSAAPSPNQGQVLSNHAVATQSLSDANRSHDIALPNNGGARYSLVQQQANHRRQDKGSSHSRVEPEPVRDAYIPAVHKLLIAGDKQSKSFGVKEPTSGNSESSGKLLASCEKTGIEYALPLLEDEDVCPTCLEEYSSENPKIIAQCSHHYHLSCIYEWMERSEKCPICGQMMLFNETS